MKTRVATAAVLCAGMIALFFFLPQICAVIIFGAFCAVGAWELLYATKSTPKHPFLYFCCAFAAAMPFISVYYGRWQLEAAIFAFTAVALCFGVFCHNKISFSAVAKGLLAAIALPLMLSSVLRICFNFPDGRNFVMIPWITVWACDSAAFFVGKALGKRKLAPYVSPKKTVAGFFGGLAGGAVAVTAYCLIVVSGAMTGFDWATAVIYGIVGAAAGQLGDLALSAIKREAGIKDYGKLFPGHGGVWDRFDSIIFAAPIFELFFRHILPNLKFIIGNG